MSIEDQSDKRVKFYGPNDYGTYSQVARAAEVLEQFGGTRTSYSVNDVLELHSVQLFVQNSFFPAAYSEAQRAAAKAQLAAVRKTIAMFFNAIDEANVSTIIVEVDFEYHADLLKLLDRYKVYARCNAATMLSTLEAAHIGIGEMLTDKSLIQHYDQELRDRLLADPANAEHLIRKYLENEGRPVHLPSSLTSSDERILLDSYLESDDANPNFLELVATARATKGGMIDAKLKLKAKRKRDAWAEDYFQNNAGIRSGCEVSISETQAEPVETSLDGMVAKLSYSQHWLEDNLDYPTILNNFIYLFEFANRQMVLTLPSYPAELGVLERIIRTGGKETYVTGAAFRFREQSAFLQIVMYGHFLRTKEIELESVIAWFFATYLKERFDAENFRFVPSTKTASYLERARHLFSEMESVVKQFSLYAEDGELDPELLAITSEQVQYKRLPSLLIGKYVYASDSQEIRTILHLVFSDQSELHYINEELRGDDAARLLLNNRVAYRDFAEYQRTSVDYLIGLGVLRDTGGRVEFADVDQLIVLKSIFAVGAASYYHYSAEARARIDDMVNSGWFVRRASLLTEAEASYFNYNLNQAEFSNGPDLRNKYLHGTQAYSEDEKRHFATYITALQLLIAIVIKINDDFWLRHDEQHSSVTPQGAG